MAKPDVDGALIGGAALDAEEFVKIVRYRDQAVG
jgi:triosephosphate isomerase